MYQTPLTPEGEDEYVYNYLTEKQLGDEIQVGCPGLGPLMQRRWCDIGVAIETKMATHSVRFSAAKKVQ